MFRLYKICFILLILKATDAKKHTNHTTRSNWQTEDPVVRIQGGSISGKQYYTVGQNKSYYAFQGIAYAQPPVGKLRFQPPVPIQRWNGVKSVTRDVIQCVQSASPVLGTEDCLYINVYTPTLESKNLPVFVWIYGGGFNYGNSTYDSYGPDYILEQDVVFVSFNYRLGIFGFLSTEDLVVPGNNGLKDAVLALQWVRNNIRSFGGNPGSVVITGESAGSAMVSYLLQSKQSQGLFHGAIMESGTSLCSWSLSRNGLEVAKEVGRKLNVSSNTTQQLVDGLREINYVALEEASFQLVFAGFLQNPTNGLFFAPVIEVDHPGAFFTKRSYELLSTGNFIKVPSIIGFNSMEVATRLLGIAEIPTLTYMTRYQTEPSLLVPVDMNANQTDLSTVGNLIYSKYFGFLPIALQPVSLSQYFSDVIFYLPIKTTVQFQSKVAPVYFYKFSYSGAIFNNQAGVGHGEEMSYLFRSKIRPTNLVDPSDILTRTRMIKMWTNFCKFRNPTPVDDPVLQNTSWPTAALAKNNLLYLDINKDLSVETNPFKSEIKFWEDLYQKYGNPPYSTY